MSIKLDSVEISDFRAYSGKKKFNFSSEKGISNLVVLYAPNGTGKTSFFDALEWSISGKINRISNNKYVRAVAKEEKGEILKNKYSLAPTGNVYLKFDNGKFYSSTTLEIKGNRKTDYEIGKNDTNIENNKLLPSFLKLI